MTEPTSSGASWLRTIVLGALVAAGSLLVMFPAWLPRNGGLVSLEAGAVETLQWVLLLLSAAMCFAASAHVRRFRTVYRVLGLGCVAAAMGEADDLLEMWLPFDSDWVSFPLVGIMALALITHPRETARFVGLAAKHPSSGFIAAALILIYVFSRLIGTEAFWRASLEAEVPRGLPNICRSYLELLACYFIFVGVMGFCLPVSRRREVGRRAPQHTAGAHGENGPEEEAHSLR